MARHVLLLEPDVDVLGQLAERLRARGVDVSLASDAATATARARVERIHMVFVAGSLASNPDVLEALSGFDLAHAPRLVLVRAPNSSGLPLDYAAYDDIEWLVKRVLEVRPLSSPLLSDQQNIRGDLAQVPLVDLLQLLATNRQTGLLSVSTPLGAGEFRLADGELLDAVYRRLDGKKAIFRLLSEKKGTFSFVAGPPPSLSRVTKGTAALLVEAKREQEEMEQLRSELLLDGDAFVAVAETPAGETSSLGPQIWSLLDRPRTLEEVLDELPALDVEILRALVDLVATHHVRHVRRSEHQIPLGASDQLSVLRALTARLARAGFSGPPRILIASAASRLQTFHRALGNLIGMTLAATPPPTIPIPYDFGTLWLGDDTPLALGALPVVDAFAPLWSLTLPGAGALVCLDARRSSLLAAVCAAFGVPVLDGPTLVESLQEGDPAQVASLLRGVIEQAGWEGR